ncbi:MAG: TIM barrel protein [Verrucomicrobia bacterium]|nr:TIM barrel protein [Verrucomicrobiota bacterium]
MKLRSHDSPSPLDPLSRRSFLKAGAAGAAAFGLGLAPVRAAASPKKIPIGLQLYSVREQCAKDLPGVLKAVKGAGYKGVEFAGYYGYENKAKDLRKLLDDHGLLCCGTHTGLHTIRGDALQKTIEFNQILGNKYLIVPGMSANSKAGWLDLAKLFNSVADKLKPLHMLTGYHAHGGDFKKFDGETAWDIFFSNTNKEVVMQLDTGNALGGGADPVAILKKYPGRATTIHLKEHGGARDAVIGGGEVKWNEVFALCEGKGTEWYIVEHERGGPDPVRDVIRCIEALRAMGKC